MLDANYNPLAVDCGKRQQEKQLQIYRELIHKGLITVDDACNIPVDRLCQAIPALVKATKERREEMIIELREGTASHVAAMLSEETGKPQITPESTERLVKSIMVYFRPEHEAQLQELLKDTGLSHFTHQPKCAITGKLYGLQHHHDPPVGRHEQAPNLGNIILCGEIHRRWHDCQFTPDEMSRYEQARK